MSSHVISPRQDLSQYKVGGNPPHLGSVLRVFVAFLLSGELLVSQTCLSWRRKAAKTHKTADKPQVRSPHLSPPTLR